MGMKKMGWMGAAFAIAGSVPALGAFTAADSGWVPLFNGTDFKGLYSRNYNAPVMNYPNIDPMWSIRYPNTDSVEIYLKAGGGELGTIRTSYHHYRVRIQYRFETTGGLNAGLLYGIDETYPRMGGDGTTARGNWPRSIECQMKQGEGADAFSIQQVTFDTKLTSNHWDVNGKAATVCEFGCTGRNFQAYPRLDKATAWNSMEAIVRGKDSAIHVLNGQEVFKLWNIRITDKSGKTLSPWDSGAIGLEAENAITHYRRWDVMELPSNGPHYLNRLFLDAPRNGETMPPGKAYNLKWRSIGDFKKVALQYNDGSGWKPIVADSVNNSGSYDWNVPSAIGSTVRIKIAGPDYVRVDSSVSVNVSTRIRGAVPNAGRAFAWQGNLLRLDGIPATARLRITDVTGHLIREIPVGDEAGDLTWDGNDASGRKAPAGFYFAGVAGSAARMRLTSF
jgi:hypothetical protein